MSRHTDNRLECQEISQWPKLAWVAQAGNGLERVRIFHGPCVEIHPDWCAEAAWPDDFGSGDFDLTDVVVGTGVRLRGDYVIFVTSSDTLNRVFWHQREDASFFSNSLPALLAVADLDLLEDYSYAEAMASIMNGLQTCQREIPSSGGAIHVAYFNNLKLANGQVEGIAKPSTTPEFVDFSGYREYLFSTAHQLGINVRATERRHSVTPLASVSSGYDSPAATLIAREAGTRECVTIAESRRGLANLVNTDDSGAGIAAQLGMKCRVYSRATKKFPLEDAVWAAMGQVGDINLALFEYPEPLCLLFTGFMGDILWDKHTIQPEFLHRKDTSGARFGEARLEQGVLLCSPVFWGCQRESRILALAHLPEMQGWTLNTEYDRPVPRRLLEEAGVSRESFGISKKVTSYNRRYGQPITPALRPDFDKFLQARCKHPGSRFNEMIAYILDGVDYYILRKVPAPFRFSCKGWASTPEPTLFFLWANERVKRRYLRAFKTSQARTGCESSLVDDVSLREFL